MGGDASARIPAVQDRHQARAQGNSQATEGMILNPSSVGRSPSGVSLGESGRSPSESEGQPQLSEVTNQLQKLVGQKQANRVGWSQTHQMMQSHAPAVEKLQTNQLWLGSADQPTYTRLVGQRPTLPQRYAGRGPSDARGVEYPASVA